MNAIVYNGEKNRAISKDSIVLDDNMYSKRSKYKSSEKTIQNMKRRTAVKSTNRRSKPCYNCD